MVYYMHSIDLISYVFFFFLKQKTAYEMRISDWSSDVCSSDLNVDAFYYDYTYLQLTTLGVAAVRAAGWASAYEEMMLGINGVAAIGRASCRESVCQIV